VTVNVPHPRPSRDDAPLVLVVVGTDMHPFDRLMRWLEGWHTADPEAATLLVQHGHTAAPALPGAVPFLGNAALREAMGRAALVVCHGGPGTITEARGRGRLPIVVPRDASLGEHVDNHQQLFTRRLHADGLVRLCEHEGDLRKALVDGLADPAAFAVDPVGDDDSRHRAVARVGRIVGDLISERLRGKR
jgi:UDP-N-acetylglucosamine transferase subunit ALG13